MKTIQIKEELCDWLINYITNTIHGLEAENSTEFNKWAKNFKREEAEFLVNMEFANDWGYDKREQISSKEATEYAQSILKRILDNWHL
ncbi:MAG: hypothetical protein KBG68_06335 [Prevotella sp.]|nr:hypothetical protein [Prevotella sp.]